MQHWCNAAFKKFFSLYHFHIAFRYKRQVKNIHVNFILDPMFNSTHKIFEYKISIMFIYGFQFFLFLEREQNVVWVFRRVKIAIIWFHSSTTTEWWWKNERKKNGFGEGLDVVYLVRGTGYPWSEWLNATSWSLAVRTTSHPSNFLPDDRGAILLVPSEIGSWKKA